MEPIVASELGMRGAADECPVTDDHRLRPGLVVEHREDLDLISDLGDARSPDEHRVHGPADARRVELDLEARQLPAVAVALHRHIETAETRTVPTTVEDAIGQQHQSCAGAERRAPFPGPALERRPEARSIDQQRHGRRLAPGQDEGIHAADLAGGPDEVHLCADPHEGGNVLAHIALKGEDADAHPYQPRSARRSVTWAISRPAMASPSPLETFATMEASV